MAMKILKSQEVVENIQSNQKNQRIKTEIIDIDDRGSRWEGVVVNQLPFGFGNVFNANGNLIYQGFMFRGLRVCYGKEFYPDSGFVYYEGNFIHNQKHGHGVMYDRMGKVQYHGSWANNGILCDDPFFITHQDTSPVIHNMIDSLVIGDSCLNSLSSLQFDKYPRLTKLTIGSKSCRRVLQFSIENCNSLESIQIGPDSFNLFENYRDDERDGECCIRECCSLKELVIGSRSFGDFSSCFELKSSKVSDYEH